MADQSRGRVSGIRRLLSRSNQTRQPAAAANSELPPNETPSALSRIGDKLFPVRPGPVPPWRNVVSLIFLMAIIWEIMWLVTFWTGSSDHNILTAWSRASQLMPVAVVLATVGAVPGFWIMRRRVEAVNAKAGIVTVNGKVVTPPRPSGRTARASEHASTRARRRHASTGKRKGKR